MAANEPMIKNRLAIHPSRSVASRRRYQDNPLRGCCVPGNSRVKSGSGSTEKLALEERSIKFVNTVAWRVRDPVEDCAASPEAMLKWLAGAGLADRRTASRIGTRWRQFPREARSFLKDASELREAIYELFVARIDARKADPAATEIVNANLTRSGRGVGLASSQRNLKWQPSSRRVAPQQLLKPVAWSAVNL